MGTTGSEFYIKRKLKIIQHFKIIIIIKLRTKKYNKMNYNFEISSRFYILAIKIHVLITCIRQVQYKAMHPCRENKHCFWLQPHKLKCGNSL